MKAHYHEIPSSIEILKGYHVQHNNWLGLYKGWLRFADDAYLDEFKELSFWMTIKCAIHNLPFCYLKDGIKYNPKNYSEDKNKQIV